MTKFIVYQDKVQEVTILEDKPGSGKIVAMGNEILCVPVEAGVPFFDDEESARKYLYTSFCGYFVPQEQ